jgi:hypothetical protein
MNNSWEKELKSHQPSNLLIRVMESRTSSDQQIMLANHPKSVLALYLGLPHPPLSASSLQQDGLFCGLPVLHPNLFPSNLTSSLLK